MISYRKAATASLKHLFAFIVLINCPDVSAEEDIWQPREASRVWQTECGSCHMAFPPALLSKSDWYLLMQGLDRHFGVNASLDAKSRDEINAFLERNAGSSWGGHSANSQRITETSWFIKRHKETIRMLAKGRVKSLVDCAACHKGNGT